MSWVPTTPSERQEMLAAIGVDSVDALFDVIPEELRTHDFNVPEGMSEMAVASLLRSIAGKNCSEHLCFLGGGYYDHYIPAAVDALSARSEFYTAYTPYQPECSQGTLQAIYEYQSAICRLTGMEFANASLYDGSTAVFEAATMSLRVTRRNRIICHGSVNPLHRQVLETHTVNLGLEIIDTDSPEEHLSDGDVACVIVQNPSFLGTIHDYTKLSEAAHAAGALLVVSFYPLSLGLLKSPGEMGADIAVAEGQSLGLPLGFGGPYLGVMATTKKCLRKMPGRIAAATQDKEGRQGFVLTLQAREQHIRREKAMSNICSNEALCALRAGIYLSLLGKEGLREVAGQCHSKTEYLKSHMGFAEVLNDGPTFNEFAVRLPRNASEVAAEVLEQGIVAGLPLENYGGGENDLLIAVTEKRTRSDLDRFADTLEKVSCS